MSDFAGGMVFGVMIGAFIGVLALGLALERAYKRIAELETAGNGPEPPETAEKGV